MEAIKYFLKIYIIPFWILFASNCNKVDNSHFIKFNGINKTEAALLRKHLENQKRENKLLKILLDELENSGHQLIIKFTDKVKIAGFKPGNDNNVQFQFKDIDQFKDENVLIEEFFHAFQAHYYGREIMHTNEKGLIHGAANIEYEARLFKALMAIYLDKPIAETPSQKGLLIFTMSLLDKNGKIKSMKLDSMQHQEYIGLVIHFQLHWKTRNEKEGITSVYDNPVDTTLGPDACFYLLRKLNSYTNRE